MGKMFKLVYNFIFHNKRKTMTLWAFVLSGYYRALLRMVPVAKLRPHFGAEGKESPQAPLDAKQRRDAYWIADRLQRVANRTPWESKCFVRALVAQRMLSAYGMASTMYLGVGKDEQNKMIAHAWVRCGPHYITGGNGEEYSTVAKFMRYPRGAEKRESEG